MCEHCGRRSPSTNIFHVDTVTYWHEVENEQLLIVTLLADNVLLIDIFMQIEQNVYKV